MTRKEDTSYEDSRRGNPHDVTTVSSLCKRERGNPLTDVIFYLSTGGVTLNLGDWVSSTKRGDTENRLVGKSYTHETLIFVRKSTSPGEGGN